MGSELDINYSNREYNVFAMEMADAGLEVIEYRGRSFYQGPAVIVSDIQEAIRATSVEVNWDNMGLDWVVYPRS